MRGIIVLAALLAVSSVSALPLDDYVAMPDAVYNWTVANTIQNDGYTFYVLRLTSQQWLTEAETNWPIWERALGMTFVVRVLTCAADRLGACRRPGRRHYRHCLHLHQRWQHPARQPAEQHGVVPYALYLWLFTLF